MEEWGTIVTTITTILPFPTNQRSEWSSTEAGRQVDTDARLWASGEAFEDGRRLSHLSDAAGPGHGVVFQSLAALLPLLQFVEGGGLRCGRVLEGLFGRLRSLGSVRVESFRAV